MVTAPIRRSTELGLQVYLTSLPQLFPFQPDVEKGGVKPHF